MLKIGRKHNNIIQQVDRVLASNHINSDLLGEEIINNFASNLPEQEALNEERHKEFSKKLFFSNINIKKSNNKTNQLQSKHKRKVILNQEEERKKVHNKKRNKSKPSYNSKHKSDFKIESINAYNKTRDNKEKKTENRIKPRLLKRKIKDTDKNREKIKKIKIDSRKKNVLLPIKKKSKKKNSNDSKEKKKATVKQKKGQVVDKTPFSINEESLKKLKEYYWKKDGIKNINEWQEIECYPLQEPFSFASIIENKESKEKRYFLVEVELSDDDKKYLKFIRDVYEILPIDTVELDRIDTVKLLENKVEEIINDYSLVISQSSKDKILYYMKRDNLGLGKLNALMKDIAGIEDISCDGAGLSLFLYHRIHGSIQCNVTFTDEEELSSFVIKLAQKCGKHISISHPMLDATMPDGSRIQMTLSTEVSTKGSTFTIRKFKEQPFSPSDLILFNTMSHEMMAYLWLAVQHGSNALISGGTASGKTSVLNAISLFIPRESKIVSIEETREINLPHPNWIPGVARSGSGEMIDGRLVGEIDLFDLMKAALRQRPEYILVGEIRGREAYVLFQAMATGHTTYSTVHADSTKSLIHRLEGEPINIPRIMLQSLDIVCIQTISRVKNKRVRRCKQIIEIIDIDPTTKEILTNEVFRWDPIKDEYQYTGKSYILDQIRVKKNMQHEAITEELKQRAKVLNWMVRNNIKMFDEVATITAGYLENPTETMQKIAAEVT
jgi:archaeal flagellar protein FlaI